MLSNFTKVWSSQKNFALFQHFLNNHICLSDELLWCCEKLIRYHVTQLRNNIIYNSTVQFVAYIVVPLQLLFSPFVHRIHLTQLWLFFFHLLSKIFVLVKIMCINYLRPTNLLFHYLAFRFDDKFIQWWFCLVRLFQLLNMLHV